MRLLMVVAILSLACTPAVVPDASRQHPVPTSTPIATPTSAPVVTGRVIAFERIGRAPPGGTSPITGRTAGGPTVVVATSAEEMNGLLTNDRVATSVTGLPPIGEGAYVAAFAGQKAYLGYSIVVTDVRAEADGLTLWVRQTPPAGETLLPLVGYPVDVIRIDRAEIGVASRVTLRDAVTGVRLATTTYCGSTRQITPLTPYDPAGPQCVWDAYSRGDTAQWLTRSLTIEGGPIIRTLRAVPGGLSEASLDDRGDGFAHAPGVRGWACAQIARSSADRFGGGTLVWFSLSRCTGNGEEAEVR
jgi:hypothetical protein